MAIFHLVHLFIPKKKIDRKRRESVAHFCQICRDLRSCDLVEVSQGTRMMFMSVGTPTHILDELVCPECKSVFMAKATQLRGRSADDPFLRQRMEMEQLARSGKLPVETRAVLLIEPFYALDYAHRMERAKGGELIGALLILMSTIAVMCALIGWASMRPDQPDELYIAVGASVAAIVLVGVTVWRVRSQRYKLWVKPFVDRCARSLRVLRPTVLEIEQTVQELRRRNMALGKVIRVEDLRSEIESGNP